MGEEKRGSPGSTRVTHEGRGVGAKEGLVSPSLNWKSLGGGGQQGAGEKEEDGVRGFGLGAEL